MIDYTFVSSIRGQGRIRTAEAARQQIYSLPVLTTYLPTRCFRRLCDSHRIQTCNLLIRSQMLYSVELASQMSHTVKEMGTGWDIEKMSSTNFHLHQRGR